MRKDIIILLIILLIVSFGVFYYLQFGLPQRIFNIGPPKPEPSEQKTAENEIPTSEEIAATTEQYIPTNKEISRGNKNKKQLIFTFDGGSGVNSADKILEVAKKHNLKTTFFVTGKFAEKYPETIKKISAAGHEIFNHTYSHPHLTQIPDEEIKNEFEKTEEIVKNLTSKTTKPFFRPPYGERNQHVWDFALSLGYQSVFWTTDALDWMPDKTADQVKTQIYSRLTNGAIILMHIGDDITGQILDEVFTRVRNDGYKIVPLSEGIK